MALMTGEQYVESIRSMNMKVFMLGKWVENPVDDPILRPSLNCLKLTYDMALMPEYEDLLTTTSNLTGKKINRFSSIHTSTEDLIKKVKMQRLMGQKTASCFQRCVLCDGANALYASTYEVDQKYGTHYFDNFKSFLADVQEKDQVVAGALTDPKGDRSLTPTMQPDPDIYLHVVERRTDGVVVSGAKAHITGITNSHEVIVMPTMSLKPEDANYAVAFAVPTDTPGITLVIGRQSCDTRKQEGGTIDVGNCCFGGVEALMIFDRVFVPNEKIFLNGETEFAGKMVELFTAHHRNSYGGCKVGVGDVLIGAAAQIAEYNGVRKVSHIKDKLVEMTHLNETIYSNGIASAVEGGPTASGGYLVDILLANVCKQNVTRFPYEITRLAEDIAGGIVVTAPSEKDLNNKVIGKYLQKYLGGVNATVEERLKILRLIENLCLGTGAVGYRTESLHGAGSPQAQRIVIQRTWNLEKKQQYARDVAGIEEK